MKLLDLFWQQEPVTIYIHYLKVGKYFYLSYLQTQHIEFPFSFKTVYTLKNDQTLQSIHVTNQ